MPCLLICCLDRWTTPSDPAFDRRAGGPPSTCPLIGYLSTCRRSPSWRRDRCEARRGKFPRQSSLTTSLSSSSMTMLLTRLLTTWRRMLCCVANGLRFRRCQRRKRKRKRPSDVRFGRTKPSDDRISASRCLPLLFLFLFPSSSRCLPRSRSMKSGVDDGRRRRRRQRRQRRRRRRR